MKKKQIKDYDPDLRSMTRLEDQATALLSNDDMNPDELLKLINMLQSRFNQIKNKDKAEAELSGVSKTMTEPDEPAEEDKEPPIPPIHDKAPSLIPLLSKDPPSFSVNDRMEILVVFELFMAQIFMNSYMISSKQLNHVLLVLAHLDSLHLSLHFMILIFLILLFQIPNTSRNSLDQAAAAHILSQ